MLLDVAISLMHFLCALDLWHEWLTFFSYSNTTSISLKICKHKLHNGTTYLQDATTPNMQIQYNWAEPSYSKLHSYCLFNCGCYNQRLQKGLGSSAHFPVSSRAFLGCAYHFQEEGGRECTRCLKACTWGSLLWCLTNCDWNF